MKKNKDTISKLREKNKRLRFELAKKKAVCGFEIVNQLIIIHKLKFIVFRKANSL